MNRRWIAFSACAAAAGALAAACTFTAEFRGVKGPPGIKVETARFEITIDPRARTPVAGNTLGTGRETRTGRTFTVLDTTGDERPDVLVDVATGKAYLVREWRERGTEAIPPYREFWVVADDREPQPAVAFRWEGTAAEHHRNFGFDAVRASGVHELPNVVPHAPEIHFTNPLLSTVSLSLRWSGRFRLDPFQALRDHPSVRYRVDTLVDATHPFAVLNLHLKGEFLDVVRALAAMGCREMRFPVPSGEPLLYTQGPLPGTLAISYGRTLLATIPY